jgi:hypothetical protein
MADIPNRLEQNKESAQKQDAANLSAHAFRKEEAANWKVAFASSKSSGDTGDSLSFHPINDMFGKSADGSTQSFASKSSENSIRAGISDSATNSEQSNYISNPANRSDPAISKLFKDDDSKVIAIGDQHKTLDIKQNTIDNMKEYAKVGVKAIGLELLPKNVQPILDRYAKIKNDSTVSTEDKKAARDAVEHQFLLSQENSKKPEEGRAEGRPALDKLTGIVDAAIDAGIHPLAIEPNISRPFASDGGYDLMQKGMQNLSPNSQEAFQNYTNSDTSDKKRDWAENTMRADLIKQHMDTEEIDDFFKTVGEARNADMDFTGMKIGQDFSVKTWVQRLHDVRNRTWAAEVSNDFKEMKDLKDDPKARVLLFAGAPHFQYEERSGTKVTSANERLKELGIKSTVLQFAGGDYASKIKDEREGLATVYGSPLPDSEQTDAIRYTEAAEAANVAGENFALRINPSGPREADWVIHLKETSSRQESGPAEPFRN